MKNILVPPEKYILPFDFLQGGSLSNQAIKKRGSYLPRCGKAFPYLDFLDLTFALALDLPQAFIFSPSFLLFLFYILNSFLQKIKYYLFFFKMVHLTKGFKYHFPICTVGYARQARVMMHPYFFNFCPFFFTAKNNFRT